LATLGNWQLSSQRPLSTATHCGLRAAGLIGVVVVLGYHGLGWYDNDIGTAVVSDIDARNGV
jgi:hypothetical protein